MISYRIEALVLVPFLSLLGPAWSPVLAVHSDSEDGRFEVVVLRGRVSSIGTASLQFVADQDSLDRVQYNGISGEELFSFRKDNLREMARYYHEAQVAAGVADREIKPLYIVLDPESNWAFAQSDVLFRYTRNGRPHVVHAPVIKLGERRDYTQEASGATVETGELNRHVLDRVRSLYQDAFPAPEGEEGEASGRPDVDREVFGSLTLSRDGETFDLIGAAERLTTEEFVGWVERAVTRDLTGRGKDGAALWNEFKQEHRLEEIVATGNRQSLKQRIVETLYHEMGHLVHYAALGSTGYRGSGYQPHMDGGSHTMQTLSTPEFAFTEGFAEAHARRFSGHGGPDPAANRIHYGTTRSFVRGKLHQGTSRLLDRVMEGRGLEPLARACQRKEPGACVGAEQSHDTYMEDLERAARGAGLDDTGWQAFRDEADRDPELAHLVGVNSYIEDLGRREGELKGRYDFLRSEHAVAGTMAGLMERFEQSERQDGLFVLHKFRNRFWFQKAIDLTDSWIQRNILRRDMPAGTASPSALRRLGSTLAGGVVGGIAGKLGIQALMKLVGGAALGPVASRALALGGIGALAIGGMFLANWIYESLADPQMLQQVRYTDKPLTLANLIEQYVHDNPGSKVEVYRHLAEITEGILVTPAQAAFIEEREKAGEALEIDIDQDGTVPGTSANARHPDPFPRDPPPITGHPDPLAYSGPRSSLFTGAAPVQTPTATLVAESPPRSTAPASSTRASDRPSPEEDIGFGDLPRAEDP